MRVGTVLIRQIESKNRSNHQVGENEQNVKQLLHKIHTPSRPSLEWQGKLGEAQSAGRDCPGSGIAGPQSGYGLDRNTRHGRIYCALLALITRRFSDR